MEIFKTHHSPEYLEYLNSLDKSFYLSILENSTNEIYVTDNKGKILYVNNNSLKNYGIKPEDLIGKNNNDIWRGNWNPPVVQKCVQEKRTIFAEQLYLLTGKKITTIVNPIFDKVGNVKYVSCIVQESSDRYDISYKKFNKKTQLTKLKKMRNQEKVNSKVTLLQIATLIVNFSWT